MDSNVLWFDRKGQDIRRVFVERWQKWVETGCSMGPSALLTIAGWPGIGKTFFLRHYLCGIPEEMQKALGFTYAPFYVDLAAEQSLDRPLEVVRQIWKEVQASKQLRRCLLVDHVPVQKMTQSVSVIREHLLIPWYEHEEGFLVFALEGRERWALGYRVPLIPPVNLGPLSEKGIRQWEDSQRTADGLEGSWGYGDALFKLGHPYLLKGICEGKGRRDVCREFLNRWLELYGLELETFTEDERKILCNWVRNEKIDDKRDQRERASAALRGEIIDWLRMVRWVGWTMNEVDDLDRWVPPVRLCLQYVLCEYAKEVKHDS